MEEAAREGKAASEEDEDYEAETRSYHDTVLSGELRKAVCRATDRDGGGRLLLEEQCTKTGRQVAEVLQEKHPDTQAPPKIKSCVFSI